MTRDYIVDGLVAKRAELAGIIDQLQRQLDQYRADLTHIDGLSWSMSFTDVKPPEFFIGREKQIDGLDYFHRHLDYPHSPIIITGPAGIGKA